MGNEIVTEQDRQDFLDACEADPVFYAENFLRDEYGEHYILEDYQKQYLRCPARNKVLFWARRLSKSLEMIFEMLHKSTFNRSFKAMTVSPSWEQSIELGERTQDIINSTPELAEMFTSTKVTKLKMKNNSRIYLTTAGRGGRSQLGKGVRYLAFDETQQIPDEVFVFLRPTLLGQKRGTKKFLVYAGTPLGRMGAFYDTYKKGKYFIKMDGIYENPDIAHQDAGDYIVFERPTAILNEKGEVVGTGTNRVTVAELEQEMNDLPMTGFLREYCLKFLDQIGEVFPQALLNSVTDYEALPLERSDKKIVMGLDLGKQRFHSVLTIGELRPNGEINIIYVKSWPLETGYIQVAREVVAMKDRYPNTLELRVDETGVGKGVIEIIQYLFKHKWRTVDVVGFDFGGHKKKQMLVEDAVAELERGSVKMIYNQKMQNEMLEFKREITDNNNIIYQKPQGGSDDYVDSLCLMLLAAREYYDRVEDETDILETESRLLGRSVRHMRRMAGVV